MKILASLILCGFIGAAQDGEPSLFSAGYEYPVPFLIAPGQLITMFAHGVPLEVPFARAPGDADLPDTLAGMSVGMFQAISYFRAAMLEVGKTVPALW